MAKKRSGVGALVRRRRSGHPRTTKWHKHIMEMARNRKGLHEGSVWTGLSAPSTHLRATLLGDVYKSNKLSYYDFQKSIILHFTKISKVFNEMQFSVSNLNNISWLWL